MDERVIFTDAAGRRLTVQDLEGASGQFTWAIETGGPVSVRAAALHEQARAAGGNGEYILALSLLDQARGLAPDWPYPVYDAAFVHLLQGDAAGAESLYAEVDRLAPRGFFTCKTTLDCLRRELAGELPPGFSRAYVSLEWADPVHKRTRLERIVAQYPSFAPAWSELASMAPDDDGRLHAIEQGLNGRPDPETRGTLLINRAIILAQRGDRGTAIAILGEVALSPQSTLGNEHKAKATLAFLPGG